MFRTTHAQFASLLLALGVSSLGAADSTDLKRLKPVPDSEPIPVIDFFRPRVLKQPKLSPNGTHIAALVTSGDDQHQLLSYDIKTSKIEVLGASGDKEIYEFTWLTDSRLIFSLSSDKLYGMGLLAADVGRFGDAHPLLQYCGAQIISIPRDNRTRPLIWARAELGESEQRDGGVVEIDSTVRFGRMANLRGADAGIADFIDARESNLRHIRSRTSPPKNGLGVGYMADKDGRLEYAFTSDAGDFSMHRLEGGEWIKCPIDLEDISVKASGEKAGEVIVLGPQKDGQPRPLQFMEAATGKAGAILLQDKAYDFDGWLYRDPASGVVVGAIYDRNGPHVAWFTEEYQQLQKVLNGFFPGVVVRIIGSDEGGKMYLVSTFSDRQPAIYSWVNLETRAAGLVKNSAPWIDPKRMQPMNIIKFKTRDGRQLDAYLTLPAGANKETPPPLVVLPHGGPWVRDTWGFDGEVQFLASRGYAVLQPNYRGSPGYGWMFPAEDEWDFRKMHDDVTDATKTVIGTGRVDAERVAIMGGSFGGYLALSGVVHEPTLYRCAVTIAGVFDWANMIKDTKYDRHDNPRHARLLRRLGDPKKEKEKFDAISPLRHVDQVRVPVMVAHGKEDHVVGVAESKRLISELEKNNVPYESLIVRGEGHGMGHVKNNVELYGRIERFLGKNLMPAKQPLAIAGASATTAMAP